MTAPAKSPIKQALGELPWAAEVYWKLRGQGKPLTRKFSLQATQKHAAEWFAQAQAARLSAPQGKKLLIFGALRYWIEHAALLGVALSGLGHNVDLAYLPYPSWHAPISSFDLRRHDAYARNVLQKLSPLVNPHSFLRLKSNGSALPVNLKARVEEVTHKDVQYTLQLEEIDVHGDLYQLRLERNLRLAETALAWMRRNSPEVVLTPNGSILELGTVFQVARYLGIPTITYEFGEQRGKIWLSKDREVMRQDTDELWEGCKRSQLGQDQLEQLNSLLAARQQGRPWENFARTWQNIPSSGGEQVRQQLGLDRRPIAMLAVNVIGDSLTLGRQLFSRNMTEWLERTVQRFADRPALQLIVRIHPGEKFTKGPSVSEVVNRLLPELPGNIHLISADDPINTYDLIEIADLGLVYTTTVGLEMAMTGRPVIVSGQTHYRGKGFTIDPESWDEYYDLLDRVPQDLVLARPTPEQIVQAWKYAYCFFFLYPAPFPWHLLHFLRELEEWPVGRVLSGEGQAIYGDTFRYLVGEERTWNL
jgi:hypothetical protein